MADSNKELGLQIHEHLKSLHIETPMRPRPPVIEPRYELERSFETILDTLGIDREDDSIQDTPRRLAKMFKDEICWGLDYSKFPSCTTVENKFGYDELIIIRNIEVKTLCEHHFMPIMGKAHIAYIPHKKVLGLSKFNRIVEFFSRRPQVQERLTEQVSAALQFILGTEDVATIITGEHFCVKFRGIEDMCSDTITSKMSGKFRDRDRPGLRAELMALINQPHT